VEETRSLIAKPAVDLVPGPAPVAPASDAVAAPTDEAPKAE
jgi:exoribonuclease-2